MSLDIETVHDTEVFTYNELKDYVNKEWSDMSDEERSMRQQEADPTFHEYVLSRLKPGNSVAINGYQTKTIFPKVTLWYRYDKKQDDYIFNHLEHGWASIKEPMMPEPKSFAQEKSWDRNSKWIARFGNLDGYVVKELPPELEWMKDEQYRGG